jgi:hypothetical protein
VQIDKDPKYLERWAATYTLVASIPHDNRFDMQYWGKKQTDSVCGTTACAAGHAALHPWFVERGLDVKIQTENAYDENYNYVGQTATGFELWNKGHFWGMNSIMGCPFDPDFCFAALGFEEYYNSNGNWIDDSSHDFTPEEVASVIRDWMVRHWGEEATAAAIAASPVRYSVEAVHELAPWHKEARAKADQDSASQSP